MVSIQAKVKDNAFVVEFVVELRGIVLELIVAEYHIVVAVCEESIAETTDIVLLAADWVSEKQPAYSGYPVLRRASRHDWRYDSAGLLECGRGVQFVNVHGVDRALGQKVDEWVD